jgi:hypothetical protein
VFYPLYGAFRYPLLGQTFFITILSQWKRTDKEKTRGIFEHRTGLVTGQVLSKLAGDLGDLGDERQHTSKPCFIQVSLMRAN